MHTHPTPSVPSSQCAAHAPPSPPEADATRRPAWNAPLEGIERLMADALIALDASAGTGPAEPGSIEYASWLRLLRRGTP